QEAFVERLGQRGPADLESGTVVVIPSLSFANTELRKITGVLHYEERLLFMLLFLRRPDLRLVYVTSLPVDPAVVDYHLRFLPDPDDARRRLDFVHFDDGAIEPLSVKLLRHEESLDRIRKAAGDPDDAYLLPFNLTDAERSLS